MMEQGHLQRSPDLEALQRRFYAACNQGDLAFVERHLSYAPATLFLGTDPNEVWDRAATLQAIAGQSAAGVRFEGGAPQGWEAGDVGWVVDLEPRFRLGEVVAPFRATSIFRREDGEWRFVHWHCAFPMANEEAVGQDLPT
jgi:ketosteroid isomerase-like protein